MGVACPYLLADSQLDHDFLYPATGLSVDVKTKGNNVHKPGTHFDCTVPLYQTRLAGPDIYIFTRTNPDLSKGWILGCISKGRFLAQSHERLPGEAYNNKGRPTVDVHLVVPAYILRPVVDLHRLCRARLDRQAG